MCTSQFSSRIVNVAAPYSGTRRNIGLQRQPEPAAFTFANDCLKYSPKFGQAQSTARIRAFRKGTPQLGRQASRDGLVLCSWQILSYAKVTVTRQKEYVCEQLNRARFITF